MVLRFADRALDGQNPALACIYRCDADQGKAVLFWIAARITVATSDLR